MSDKTVEKLKLNKKPKRLQHWNVIAVCLGYCIIRGKKRGSNCNGSSVFSKKETEKSPFGNNWLRLTDPPREKLRLFIS